ncbi:MAG: GTP 3',8-cyclase MoaA, partial [Armatimonadota bacterium]
SWRYGLGSVGVIAAVTNPPCSTCNRLRVTSRGFLRPCLTAATELDLRPHFARANPEEALRQALLEAIGLKPARGMHADGTSAAGLAMCRLGG